MFCWVPRGMEEDILAPLRRWQEGLAIAKVRHELGYMHLIGSDMHSICRTVTDLQRG